MSSCSSRSLNTNEAMGPEHALDIATDAVSAVSLGGENMSYWTECFLNPEEIHA